MINKQLQLDKLVLDKGQSKSTYGTGCFLLMNIGKILNYQKINS